MQLSWDTERRLPIALQVIYDANVIITVPKANVRLVHDSRKMEVWFLRASHLASSNPSLKKMYATHTTRTSKVRLS